MYYFEKIFYILYILIKIDLYILKILGKLIAPVIHKSALIKEFVLIDNDDKKIKCIYYEIVSSIILLIYLQIYVKLLN